MSLVMIDEKQMLENLKTQTNPFFEEHFAFYSSWFGGVTTNPRLMLLPMDDHMVHRGDGVFEAIKAVARSVYLLDEHLQRLFKSAEKIAIKAPFNFDEMKAIILDTLRVADRSEAIIRIFLSRGPGSFSVNPYDAVAPQFYVAITRLRPPAAEKYTQGVIIGKSEVPVKISWMAQVKSCNYLPNVLMKKEAVDRGLDFVIGTDDQGHVTESATENIMIVDQNKTIVYPTLDQILKGTTMIRACELARENGLKVAVRPVSIKELQSATEVMITGTSLNILPVVEYEGQKIGAGKPGPIAKQLQEWMLNDIKSGPKLTPY